MGKIIVIYHSQQYGNTKMLAEALAEGAREAGAEVNLINTNERRVTLEEFLSADGVAIGTPDYFSYVAGTVKTFFDDMYLWDQSGKPVKGKPAALFFSCGGGGKVRQPFESLAQRFFRQVGEMVGNERPISNEAKKKCLAQGKELVKNLSQRTLKK
jgi:multimeric flavodoxin WrbA